jgi:hypothetical protein
MIRGRRIIYSRTPKCASTYAAGELVRTGVGAMLPGPTHRGLDGVDGEPGAIRVASIRDPWAWHLSHYRHWLKADGALGDRLTEWGHVDDDSDPLEQLRATVANMVDPARPYTVNLGAWPDMREAAEWMRARRCGLLTWGYVRQVYPRWTWGLDIDRLIALHDAVCLADGVIDAAQAAQGLSEVMERLGVDYQPGEAVNVADEREAATEWGDPREALGPELCDLIADRERLICAVYGYPGPVPAIRWLPLP